MRAGPALVVVAALALTACQKKSEPPVGAAAQQPPAAKGGPLPPSFPPGEFDAISNTATSITGDLTAVDGGLKFDQGLRYTLTGQGTAKAGDRFASSGGTWSTLMNIPATAEVAVFRIVVEDRGLARNGGFCGQDSATFLAVHQGLDGGGAPALFINGFKGEQPPGPAGPETNLCGTFMYAPKEGDAAKTEK